MSKRLEVKMHLLLDGEQDGGLQAVVLDGVHGAGQPGSPLSTLGQSVSKQAQENVKVPAQHEAARAHEREFFLMYCHISHPRPE